MGRANGSSLLDPGVREETFVPPKSCRGLTRKGTPCRRNPVSGELFCAFHKGAAEEAATHAFDEGTHARMQGEAPGEDSWGETATGESELSGAERQRLHRRLWLRIKGFLASFPGMDRSWLRELKGIYEALWLRVDAMNREQRARIQGALAGLLESDLFDRDFWEGLWFVLRSSAEARIESMGRHWRGEHELDEFGMDEELLDNLRPVLNFLYKVWWRVSAHGVDHVPDEGRTLLAVNHSGVLPFDAAMVMMAVWNEHPSPRPVRTLHLRWFASIPFVAPLLARTGQVVASPENARALLEKEQLVSVFPEGIKGVGKLFKDRYKLARFGRGGFIRSAMETLAPIVPVAVVGAEEIYPTLARADWIGRPLGMPYFPITPTFPWFGLLGVVPLPSKWSIDFCKPVRFRESARDVTEDFLVVSLLTEMIRKEIQDAIYRRLKRRRSIWY